jgi:hypothetical protein
MRGVGQAEHTMASTTVSACALDEEEAKKIGRKFLPSRLIGLKLNSHKMAS